MRVKAVYMRRGENRMRIEREDEIRRVGVKRLARRRKRRWEGRGMKEEATYFMLTMSLRLGNYFFTVPVENPLTEESGVMSPPSGGMEMPSRHSSEGESAESFQHVTAFKFSRLMETCPSCCSAQYQFDTTGVSDVITTLDRS